MTYYESAEDVTISQARAKLEVEKHCCDWEEFVLEVGLQAQYKAQVVLEWLGY